MISAFGVDHEEISKRKVDPKRKEKAYGSAVLTGLGAAAVAPMVMGRGRANKWGGGIASKVTGHAEWSANRIGSMKNKKLINARTKYARKLYGTGKEMGRTEDTKEVTGRAATAIGAGTLAGGAVAARKRLTPVDERKRS